MIVKLETTPEQWEALRKLTELLGIGYSIEPNATIQKMESPELSNTMREAKEGNHFIAASESSLSGIWETPENNQWDAVFEQEKAKGNV